MNPGIMFPHPLELRFFDKIPDPETRDRAKGGGKQWLEASAGVWFADQAGCVGKPLDWKW